MLLRVLGSGTVTTPTLKNCSGYLINDELLLDCGPGIWRGLGKNNIKNQQIKIIAFSHFHADHVSDLAPLLLERYLLPKKSISDLYIIGPPGLKNWFKDFSNLFGQWMQNIPIELVEIDSLIACNNYEFNSLPTGHTFNSICYRIEDNNGKSIFYSGDSGEHENLKLLSKNTDIAIFEASNIEETKIDGHLTPKTAAEIAMQSNAKKLMLTHFYPEVYHSAELTAAKNIFKNNIIIAEDNLTIKI